MNNPRKHTEYNKQFDSLKLTLASPDDILDWSYGEVTKAETINYRTFKPEPDGIFCEKIFGPSKNYECYCGKYKKIRYKGIICDKCGVEVTTKDVRRERMGHIKLAVPVTHVWFAYGIPNKLSIVLDIPQKKMLAVVYYSRYMVTEVDDEKRDEMLAKAEELKGKEGAEIEAELKEVLAEEEEMYKDAEKDLKKDKKGGDINKGRLEHEYKQNVAKIRKEFAERAEELDSFYAKLIELLTDLHKGSILTEDEYIDIDERELLFFTAKMGAEAIEDMLSDMDIEQEIVVLEKEIRSSKGETRRKLIRRLQYLEGFRKNTTSPTWMVLNVLPVIPPELRPIIPLSGGKFATSDLNDLYRRIINRNNRLKRLIEIGAPDVILRNEKRMLQESVDALIDNSHRPSKAMLNNKRLPYQSLTDELRGKKGIFRRNLLGKRVDYSGRAVIIGDITLSLDQCGLPKSIALEMFKPFVINELMEKEIAPNVRLAKEMIESSDEQVWDVLEEVIKNKPVLLNRAPTLHKYSIQAFYPKLVEGEAIRIHPLVCKAFNADFDGDQMAVHLLLTEESVEEAKDKMMASKNTVSIANGKVLANPAKDMLLGFYMLTDMNEVEKPRMFANGEQAVKAFHRGTIAHDEMIMVKEKGEVHKTSVGRVIFNQALPEDYPFVNERVGSDQINTIVDEVKNTHEDEIVITMLDDLKLLGFKYATDLGFSFAMEDCKIDLDVESRIHDAEKKDLQLQENYLMGLSTMEEKTKLSTEMWNNIADELAQESWGVLEKNNPVFEMVESGANGGKLQARQILTIKGMVRDSSGSWVPLPIKGNYRDGLSALEYFVAANGGRKGVADTALRTSKSGYLTRKLVDVAHSVIIRMEDCGYDGDGLTIKASDERRISFAERITGRVLAKAVTGVAKKGDVITPELAKQIEKEGIEEVNVRTPISCESPSGICKKCYGQNIESNEEIEMGRAVGVIAAQSIGEPSTQMTMRTFHTGGVQKTDITQGLPRVEELFEARTPKAEAEVATVSGKVSVEVAEDDSRVVLIVGKKRQSRKVAVADAKKVSVTDGAKVKAGQVMYVDADGTEKQAPFDGEVKLEGGILELTGEVKAEETITTRPGENVLVKDGDEIEAGQAITEGSIDPKKLAETVDMVTAQRYILDEIQKVFNEQGISIADIHLEVIIRQMARLGRVINSGDNPSLVVGSLVNRFRLEAANKALQEMGKNKSLIIPMMMGIKTSALYTESFLSAMSFEQQVKVLTNASIVGKVDKLRGMKENVMIGRRIPAGDEAEIDPKEEVEDILNS